MKNLNYIYLILEMKLIIMKRNIEKKTIFSINMLIYIILTLISMLMRIKKMFQINF